MPNKKYITAAIAVAICAIWLQSAPVLARSSSVPAQSAASVTLQPEGQSTQQSSSSTQTQHGGFTIAPAHINGNDNGLAHGYNLDLTPGGKSEEFAYIKNFADSTLHFSLYGADPTVSNTGSPAYKTRDQSINGPGTWIKFDQPEIDLKSGEEKTVRFIVSVPPDIAPGDYRAGITMEKGNQSSNVPGITIATRMVSQAKIKIAAGAAQGSGTPEAAAQPLAWTTYYFWISFGLFIISLALLVWALLHEKKTKHGHHPGHPLHKGGHRPHTGTHHTHGGKPGHGK